MKSINHTDERKQRCTVGIVVLYRDHRTKNGGKTRGEKGEILFERLGKMHRVATAKGRTHRNKQNHKMDVTCS